MQLNVVVVVIVLLFDLQLPVQSVPITPKVVSSNPTNGDVYSIQNYMIKFVRLAIGLRFSPDTLVSFANNTDHHDITEIMLIVILNTITLTLNEVLKLTQILS